MPAAISATTPAPLRARLVRSDKRRSAEVSKKCALCHTFDKGGRNKIGPNLHGIIGRDIASIEGCEYSEALNIKDGNWTFELLDCLVTKQGNACLERESLSSPWTVRPHAPIRSCSSVHSPMTPHPCRPLETATVLTII